jgi:hypothetical protein
VRHRFAKPSTSTLQPDLFCSSIPSISKATLVRLTSPDRAPTGEVRKITLPFRY